MWTIVQRAPSWRDGGHATGLYKPRAEATKVVSVAVALLLLAGGLYSAGLGLDVVLVGALYFLLVVAVWGGAGEPRWR